MTPTRMVTSETFVISHSTRASMPRTRSGVASRAVITWGGVIRRGNEERACRRIALSPVGRSAGSVSTARAINAARSHQACPLPGPGPAW